MTKPLKNEAAPSTSSPYLSKKIYQNYASSMKNKNIKRKKDGLQPILVRSYEDWSGK